jgi:hypothetical protein
MKAITVYFATRLATQVRPSDSTNLINQSTLEGSEPTTPGQCTPLPWNLLRGLLATEVELVDGQYNSQASTPATAFTKRCPPEDGVKSFENAEAAVDKALEPTVQKQIALLQYHIWDYSDDTYLHNIAHLTALQTRGKIGLLGVTNTDAARLELLVHSGF